MAHGLRQRVTWRAAALIGGESALMAGVALAAAQRLLAVAPNAGGAPLLKAGIIAAIAQLCLYCGDLYDSRVAQDRRERFARTLEAVATCAVLMALLYVCVPALVVAPGVAVFAAGSLVAVVTIWRAAFSRLSQLGRAERLMVVGTGASALRLCRDISERRELGMTVVGLVSAAGATAPLDSGAPAVLGTVDELPDLIAREHVDRVIVSLDDARGRLPMHRLLDARLNGVQFVDLASAYEQYGGKVAVEDLRPSWIVLSSGFGCTRRRLFVKRAMDVVAASIGLILAAPALVVTAAAVRLTSRGPALYHQTRVGRNGRTFRLHKFRSMRADAEASTGAVWAAAVDSRVTPIGRWLRRTRGDELPQLWNVLVGDMSLVGPRPERPEFVGRLAQEIPFYGIRHTVKPGLTGWAQVCYPYGATVEDAREKLQYDLFYLKNFSLALDVLIALRTIKIVLLGRGAR